MGTKAEWQILDDAFNQVDGHPHHVGAALRDLFALGVVLHAQGHTTAGLRAVQNALRALGPERLPDQLREQLLTTLPGNEPEYLQQVRGNSDFNGLLG